MERSRQIQKTKQIQKAKNCFQKTSSVGDTLSNIHNMNVETGISFASKHNLKDNLSLVSVA